jgi:hypothetical protein
MIGNVTDEEGKVQSAQRLAAEAASLIEEETRGHGVFLEGHWREAAVFS